MTCERSREQLRDVARIDDRFDLAELRGYHYHSGVVFAAYAQGQPYAIALGGRYDEVGKAFGRARPATGFSMDLREAARRSLRIRPAQWRAGALRAGRCRASEARRSVTRPATPVVIELPGRKRRTMKSMRAATRAPQWANAVIEKVAGMARNVVVIGTQWGDEGKGKIVDWLTDHAQGVVRFQGGHNAGHTLVIGGRKTVLHLIPVGHTARATSRATSATAWWCRPQALIEEMDELEAAGVDVRDAAAHIAKRAR